MIEPTAKQNSRAVEFLLRVQSGPVASEMAKKLLNKLPNKLKRNYLVNFEFLIQICYYSVKDFNISRKL
jgi:hypothetical protein